MIRTRSVVLVGEHRDGRGRIVVGPLRSPGRIEAARETMWRAGYRDVGTSPLQAAGDLARLVGDLLSGAARVTHAEMVDVAQGRLPDEVASALVYQVDAEREADLRGRIVAALEEVLDRQRLTGEPATARQALELAVDVANGGGDA